MKGLKIHKELTILFLDLNDLPCSLNTLCMMLWGFLVMEYYLIYQHRFQPIISWKDGLQSDNSAEFPILCNHLYYSMYWWQTDIFLKTVSAISCIFFIGLGTFFCFFYSFLFGAFNPVSVITGSVFLSFFPSAVEAIHPANSIPPVTFIVKSVLLGLLVILVACGFCFLLSDCWLHVDIPSLSYLECQPARCGTRWPPSSKLLNMCPVLLKLVGPPCVLKFKHMLKYFIERE